jgi:hypothetical protein
MLFELLLLFVTFRAKLFQVLRNLFHFTQPILRQFEALGLLHMLANSRFGLVVCLRLLNHLLLRRLRDSLIEFLGFLLSDSCDVSRLISRFNFLSELLDWLSDISLQLGRLVGMCGGSRSVDSHGQVGLLCCELSHLLDKCFILLHDDWVALVLFSDVLCNRLRSAERWRFLLRILLLITDERSPHRFWLLLLSLLGKFGDGDRFFFLRGCIL